MANNSRARYFVITISLVAFLLIIFFLLIKKSDKEKLIAVWKDKGASESFDIQYPYPNTMFPPDIAAPTFMWVDTTESVNSWLVLFKIKGEGYISSSYTSVAEWRPAREIWEQVKLQSKGAEAEFHVLGYNLLEPDKLISSGTVSFTISKDSVSAPIFYRDVILPVLNARNNLDSIKWRICDISSYEMAHVALENLPVCGNCHSFSMDGSTFGMDVDASMDKGAYTILDNDEEVVITNDKIVTWTSISKDPCLGLLSKVSPNGRYAITTIDDNSVLVNHDDPMYSQFFFPIRGEVAVYDRVLDTMYRLPGASDPEWCQSNPNWSPDGKEIIFTRSPAISASESGITDGFTRKTEVNKPFTDKFVNGERDYKYDLYKIPFNDGRGGEPIPVAGASDNGKSNYFARYSPDGKWIVFCKANNFMLLMGDSKLYIMPAEGGEVRELECNLENMNSYHSWSPNSKWLVVATKERGPYTQMYLTHIDENGHASPPVFIENAKPPKRAVNIPEFVNWPIHKPITVVDSFTETGDYLTIAEAKYRATTGELDKALKAVNKAIRLDPDNYDQYYVRGYVYSAMGEWDKALKDYNTILRVNPGNNQALHNRGIAWMNLGKFEKAIGDFSINIKNKPNDTAEYYNRALSFLELKQFQEAIDDFTRVIELDESDIGAVFNKGLAYYKMGKVNEAVPCFENAVSLSPNHEKAGFYLGLVNFMKGDYKKAEKSFEKVLAINPENNLSRAYYAFALHNSGNINKSGEQLEMLVDKEVKDPEVYSVLAKLYVKMQQPDKAINLIGKALSMQERAEYYTMRGDVYAVKKDFVQSVRDYDKAINLNPDLASAYYTRGMAKIELGYKEDACNDLNAAFKKGYVKAIGAIQKNCVNK